jgi:NDP-sugar pyrophosphorylase family protein
VVDEPVDQGGGDHGVAEATVSRGSASGATVAGSARMIGGGSQTPLLVDAPVTRPPGRVVHDDGTTTNDDRLGAVRDLQLVVERAGLADEELLVVAGDNLFDFSLSEMADWWRGKGAGTGAVALYDCGDLELATQYGIATTNADDRIVDFVEKPSAPSSTLSATVVYMLAADHVRLIQTYISDGHGTDNIGSFLGWLAERRPVYGYRFHGRWYDIGNLEQLAEADNHLRRLVGLPERDAYEPD